MIRILICNSESVAFFITIKRFVHQLFCNDKAFVFSQEALYHCKTSPNCSVVFGANNHELVAIML